MITQGPGLVFVVFPHALAKMPLPQFWSVVFFGMLVMLGIDSQFATVEVIITSLKVYVLLNSIIYRVWMFCLRSRE